MTIPFNRPVSFPPAFDYMQQALANGKISGDGEFTRRCHALLEEALGVPRALLTTSCTHALEMSALLLEIQPGDEVILPSFTFVSTVNAFVLRGARPVFVDVRPDTLNLDERLLEEKITPRTRLIVPVHYAGIACEMDAILETAARHGLAVVEDNAHGLFGKYKGRYLGTFGQLATQSFHETKNFMMGEGGALLINDPRLIERAEILREKGTNRARFFRGQVDKYTWVDVGSSYLPADLLAAFLLAQLEARETIQARRRHIWQTYQQRLADWAQRNSVQQPTVPAEAEPAWHLYYLLLPDLETRQRFIAHMAERGVKTVFHYLPLHLSDMGQRFGGRRGDCPVTESVSDRLVRLPLYNDMQEDELETILEAVEAFRC